MKSWYQVQILLTLATLSGCLQRFPKITNVHGMVRSNTMTSSNGWLSSGWLIHYLLFFQTSSSTPPFQSIPHPVYCLLICMCHLSHSSLLHNGTIHKAWNSLHWLSKKLHAICVLVNILRVLPLMSLIAVNFLLMMTSRWKFSEY